jgi:ribosomal protein L32
MSKHHVLECGCLFDGDGENWKPCKAHIHSTLNKVRKAHAEVVSRDTSTETTERCDNCGDMKIKGTTCMRCGVGPRVGG